MKKVSPTARFWIYTLISLCVVSSYAYSAYAVYGGMRTPRLVEDIVPNVTVSRETARVQKQIYELFLNEKDVASIFTIVEALGVRHGVTLAIESVSNPVPTSRGPGIISTIEIKLSSKGPLANSLAAIDEIHKQPYLIQLVSLDVTESRDAQAPQVQASLRFFVHPEK